MKIRSYLYLLTICNMWTLSARRCLEYPPQSSQPTKDKISLDQAIAFAQTNRSSLQELLFASKSQRNKALAALSGYLPQISVNSRFLSAKDRALPKNQQYITIDQLLFSFAGPVEEYRIEKIGSDIADLQALFRSDEIRYEVEQAFFNVYLLRTRIAPINTGEIAAKAHLQKTTDSNEQGLLSSYLFEKGKADFNYAMSAIFGYGEQVTIAQTNFFKAVGGDTPFLIDMTNARAKIQETLNTIQTLPYDEEFFKEAAHALRKDLASNDLEIMQREKLKQLEEKSYLPSASLYANIETGQPALAVGLRQLPGNFWQAGIQFSWNFDGLGNAHRAAAEEAALQGAIFAKQNKERTIDQEVSNSYHELQQLKKELDANCTDQSPEELMLQQKKRYEIGDLSETDYKKALYDWEQAEFHVRDLEVKTVLKYKELLFKSGYPKIDNPPSKQSIES